MALAFYELSGGDNFVPRKAELMAAAKAEQAKKDSDRQARLASVEPEQVQLPKAVEEVKLSKAPDAVVTRAAVTDQNVTVATAALASEESAQGAVPTTLISLEQSGEMFARPLTQLGATPAEARPRMITQPQPQADLREVAGSRVNMRSGPGTGYDVLTSLTQGTEVEVIESDGAGWVKLRAVDEDIVGWMAEYLLTEPTG